MHTVFHRPHLRIVQSRQNSRVKQLRAGLTRGVRSDEGLVSLEGQHLIEEALRSGLRLHTVFVRQGSEPLLDALGSQLDSQTELLALPEEVFASAVTTESPQGIAALAAAPVFSIEDALRGPAPLVVIAAGLQDPGNLGALVRSAEAFGASGVVMLPGTVSLWNPKTVRASSGSVFRLPVVSAREDEALDRLRSGGLRLVAATVESGVPAPRFDFTQATALLIGNEGAGLSAALVARSDAAVTIPCPGPVESLNAAVAAGVLLYEAARQRSGGGAR